MKDVALAFFFLVYQIFVWGSSGYVVFILDKSAWVFFLSLFVSILGIIPLRLDDENHSSIKTNVLPFRKSEEEK